MCLKKILHQKKSQMQVTLKKRESHIRESHHKISLVLYKFPGFPVLVAVLVNQVLVVVMEEGLKEQEEAETKFVGRESKGMKVFVSSSSLSHDDVSLDAFQYLMLQLQRQLY